MKTLRLLLVLLATAVSVVPSLSAAQVRDELRKAGVYVEAGRIDEAAAMMRGFEPRGRDEQYAWYLLGAKVAMARAQSARALDYFERAQRIAGNSYPATIGKARAHLALGQLMAARLQAEAAQKLAPSPAEPELIQAEIELRTGKPREALQRMEALALRQPRAEDAAVARARLLLMMGDVETARTSLGRFVEVHPRSPSAVEMLAELSYAAGDTEVGSQMKSRAAALYGEQGKTFRRDVALAWVEARGKAPQGALLNDLPGEAPAAAPPSAASPEPVIPAPPPQAALLPRTAEVPTAAVRFPFPADAKITGGSGFVIDGGRKVVTNRHVVEGGKEFAIRTGLGEMVKARVVVASDKDDLALLELEQPLPAERAIPDDGYAKSTVGKTVVVMGYPLWYLLGESSPSLTNGIVSKGTGLKDDTTTFQLTAKINKGNSGGPVFDMAGNVVGITFGKLDAKRIQEEQGFTPEDVNFAIHVDRLPPAANVKLGARPAATRELSIEQLYQQMLGKVVMVATYR